MRRRMYSRRKGSILVSPPSEKVETVMKSVTIQSQGSSPHFAFRGVYDIGPFSGANQYIPYCCQDYANPVASLGINHVISAQPQTACINALATAGLNGVWYLGGWDNVNLVFTHSDATVTTDVNNVKNTVPGNTHYYYVADEPTYSTAFQSSLASRLSLIRSLDPLAICCFADYAWSGHNQLNHWASDTTIDIVFMDDYSIRDYSGPCHGVPGTQDLSVLSNSYSYVQAAKALRSGLRFFAIAGMCNDQYCASVSGADGTYTGLNAVMSSFPGATLATTSTANQIQQQVDFYRARSEYEGIGAYSYTPTNENSSAPSNWTGHLRNRPDLVTELKNQFIRS